MQGHGGGEVGGRNTREEAGSQGGQELEWWEQNEAK